MHATALRAVSEPRRQQILRLVWDRERPAGDIAASFDVTFGAVSQHLRVLHDAGLVSVRRDGRRRCTRPGASTWARCGPCSRTCGAPGWRSSRPCRGRGEEPRG
jgi:DNA-binding transcriptional ArsR family regulator